MISTLRAPEVVVYPDSDKVGARSAVAPPAPGGPRPLRLNFRARDAVSYWDGEVPGAQGVAGPRPAEERLGASLQAAKPA